MKTVTGVASFLVIAGIVAWSFGSGELTIAGLAAVAVSWLSLGWSCMQD